MFQLQIAHDSTFQWLVYGSMDGFWSKYRGQKYPKPWISNSRASYVPPLLMDDINYKKFRSVLDGESPQRVSKSEIELFFRNALAHMRSDSLITLRTLLKEANTNQNKYTAVINILDAIYGGKCEFLDCGWHDYIIRSGLKLSDDDIHCLDIHTDRYTCRNVVPLARGQQYYWRVRIKDEYTVKSAWSPVSVFSVP